MPLDYRDLAEIGYDIQDEEWDGEVDPETGIVVYPDDEWAQYRIRLAKQQEAARQRKAGSAPPAA